MTATLLVELFTEELPPKLLRSLGEVFRLGLLKELERAGLCASTSGSRGFATPRRLAVVIEGVLDRAPDREVEKTGPAVGAPAQAVAGFAKKLGVEVSALGQVDSPKGKVYAFRQVTPGESLDRLLAPAVERVLEALPVARRMRWGDGNAQFVRPVHGLVQLHGERVVPGSVLGLRAGNVTQGHRFQSSGPLPMRNADGYEDLLRDAGQVIADFDGRRRLIDQALKGAAAREHASLGPHEDLLDEVTALVEHPSVYVAGFDPAFLAVPQECLILTMRQNQKYFPLFDAGGILLPKFLVVSNMQLADPKHIIAGNQRVVRPRLEDARFFFEQDRRRRLESRVPELAKVVHHNKLGSQLDRVMRIQQLAGGIAESLGADRARTERAAWLAKADLLTGMVGEFPELQGTMGRYYALHDGEAPEIATAIEMHYRPRFAGDSLPEEPVACAVALADRLDSLAGLFGIGQMPTGDRDPFALRRAALGVIRILVENRLQLALPALLAAALASHPKAAPDTTTWLDTFFTERLRGFLLDRGATTLEAEALLARRPDRLDLLPMALEALQAFQKLPEAGSLAAANKRIGNILRQAGDAGAVVDPALLSIAEEQALERSFQELQPVTEAAYGAGRYSDALRGLASLRAPVDAFFEKVMVMDADLRVRANRIALLGRLHGMMNRIADLSKLSA